MRRYFAAALALALAGFQALPANAQDAKTVVANASKASGYDGLNTIEYIGSGQGDGGGLGQAQSPTAGWDKRTLRNYSRFIDYGAGTSQRNALLSRPLDSRGQLPGGGGLAPTAEGPSTSNIAANATWAQKLEINLSPPGFLKMAAAASGATASMQTVSGKRFTVVTFPVEQKAPSGLNYKLAGYINDQNMVEKVETWLDEPTLIGDMLVEQSYTGYKDFNGVKFPTRIVQRRAGLISNDFTITDVKANGMAPAPLQQGGARGGGGRGAGAAAPAGAPAGGAPAGAAAAPAGGARGGGGAGAPAAAGGAGGGARGGGGGGAAAAAAPTSRKLGDGIWLVTGGYRNLVVEFKDYVVMIDAPNNVAQTTPMIAEAKRLVPNKPIRYMINTHSHFDHAAGMRAMVLEGATIITQELNKEIYERWFANPRTLVGPDELEKSGKKPKFEYVSDKRVLKDDMNTLEIYHLRDVSHSEDMMVVYVPKIKAVFEADAFNAPAADAPAPAADQISGLERQLINELDRLKIDYTHVIPAHQPGGGDRDVAKAELLRRIGK